MSPQQPRRRSARNGSAHSREAVLEAALALIDRDGIERLTMRGLGSELGVDAMMIYRYFPSKAALLDGVMSRIWSEVGVPDPVPGEAWEELLAQTMHGLRRVLIAHPGAISILATRPASGADLFTLLERLLGALAGAGLEADETTADLLNALVNYTVGHVLAEVGEPAGGETDQQSHLLMLAASFPHLAAVFNSGWQYDAYRQFDRAVRSMIAGRAAIAPLRADPPISAPDRAASGPTEART